MTQTWIEGFPTEPGYYWFYYEDQGGWPFITMNFVYKSRNGLFVTCLNEGDSSTTSQLNRYYPVYKYIEIERPNE